MITFGFYSAGTPYEAEALLFRASLDRVGTRHVIRPFPSKGDWYANTAHKATLIRDFRNEVSGAFLYCDVDAFVHENYDAYFDELAKRGADFGAHWFAGPAKGHNRADICACLAGKPCNRPHRLLSGTLFFGDTAGARTLLDNWVAINDVFRSRGLIAGGGQKNLWYLLTCMEDQIKIAKLPGRYCYVFDKPWGYPENEPRIIEHTIASRDNRVARRNTTARRSRILQLYGVVSPRRRKR